MSNTRRLMLSSSEPIESEKVILLQNYQADGNGFDISVTDKSLFDFSTHTLFIDIDNFNYVETIDESTNTNTNSELVLQLTNFISGSMQQGGAQIVLCAPTAIATTSRNKVLFHIEARGEYAQTFNKDFTFAPNQHLKLAYLVTDYTLSGYGWYNVFVNGQKIFSEKTNSIFTNMIATGNPSAGDGNIHIGSLNLFIRGKSGTTLSFSTQKFNEVSIYNRILTDEEAIALTTV